MEMPQCGISNQYLHGTYTFWCKNNQNDFLNSFFMLIFDNVIILVYFMIISFYFCTEVVLLVLIKTDTGTCSSSVHNMFWCKAIKQ